MTSSLTPAAAGAPAHGPPAAAGAPDPAAPDARAVLDALDVGVACVTADWRIAFVTPAWCDALGGVDPAAYVGADLWAAFPAFAHTPEAAIVRATRADGVPRGFRVRYQDARVDGTFDVRVRRHQDGAGRLTLVLAVQNVTAQKQLEQVQDRLLESVGEGLLVVAPDWTVTYVNAAAERATGVARARVLGRPLWHAYPALVGSAFEAAWHDTMASRRPHAARTVAIVRRPGVVALFDAQSYPVPDGGLLVLFSEVSARERQARALAERSAENERLRALARTMAAVGDSAALLDALCAAAVALCGAAGATVAEVVDGTEGRFVAAVNHPPAVRGHRFPLAGTLTAWLLAMQPAPRGAPNGSPNGVPNGAPDRAADVAPHGGSGDAALGGAGDGDHSPRTVLLRVPASEAVDAASGPDLADGRRVGDLLLAPLAAHGETLGVLAVSRAAGDPPFSADDEQRLRVVADHASLALYKARLVEAAQEANDTKSAFLATVSHELRTPLTALTGYGELLADEIFGPLTSDQAEFVDRIRVVTHQLTAMIEEILTFSALEAGREVVRPAPTDVAEVALAVAAVVEPLAEQKGLAFRGDVPPVPPPLVTDPDKLRQILVNLCGNAVKFTARGAVTLAVTTDASVVRFAVADTGVGIAGHDLPRLFHAFAQLDTGLTRRYGGTGLGLYISQRLARLLGGRIEVASTPGAGSTFTLTLPLAPPGHAG